MATSSENAQTVGNPVVVDEKVSAEELDRVIKELSEMTRGRFGQGGPLTLRAEGE
jgi:hypothetical protein